MTSQYDLIIRNGLVADGLGSDLFPADVAIKDGHIAAVGSIADKGTEEIDAAGLLVTPGFVDIHTHYDGQATWDDRLLPSSWHGVTTLIMGSCGVGFAPVRPSDHQSLIDLMEGIEDIPGTALHEGLTWEWETFRDYLELLGKREYDVDIGTILPHGPLRLYVMGERASRLEMANAADVAQMREIARDAISAGALGFSTSRSINHKSTSGDLTPSFRAAEEELSNIALGLSDAGAGVLQWMSDFHDQEREEEYGMLQRIVEQSGRPMSVSVGQTYDQPDVWRQTMSVIGKARKNGLQIRAQIAPRPVGVILGLTATNHPFRGCPSFQKIDDLPLSEKVSLMRDPHVRRALIDEAGTGQGHTPIRYTPSRLFPMGDRPDYGQDPESSVQAIADRTNCNVFDVTYDLLLEDEGANLLFFAAANYFDHNFDAIREMLSDPASIIGIGDGGAHVGMISDASFPTTALTMWGLKESETTLSLPDVIRRQTSEPAKAVELFDRGIIAPGMKADINVIDIDQLSVKRPYVSYDLPAGAKRLLQRADGYVATIVSGVVTYRNGEATGALPGRLVRGAQPQAPREA